MQKFNKGDRVKVKYGHVIWSKEEMNIGKYLGKAEFGHCYDIRPALTEDVATVEYEYKEQYGGVKEGNEYSLKFDKHGSIAWFNEADLILQTQ